ELVESLHHANGWRRDTAQRLLVEGREQRVLPLLRRLAATAELPQTRVQALWTIEGLGGLDAATWKGALADSHPRVREQAVSLSEARLAEQETYDAFRIALAVESDIRVRMRLAAALAVAPQKSAVEGLVHLAVGDVSSHWMRLSILAGLD